jgi:hypothetical protein
MPRGIAFIARIDDWIGKRAHHPRLFYLFFGMLWGFVFALVPRAFDAARFFVHSCGF